MIISFGVLMGFLMGYAINEVLIIQGIENDLVVVSVLFSTIGFGYILGSIAYDVARK